mgnify:CR=1 FL=1
MIIRSNSSAVDFALLKDGKLIELNKEIEDNLFANYYHSARKKDTELMRERW